MMISQISYFKVWEHLANCKNTDLERKKLGLRRNFACTFVGYASNNKVKKTLKFAV